MEKTLYKRWNSVKKSVKMAYFKLNWLKNIYVKSCIFIEDILYLSELHYVGLGR